MIKPGEVQQKSSAVGVRDQQIEKDYILSWILQGIAQSQELSEVIIFKGGTVLKKTYFKNYRFSEDLDFTLINEDISKDQIFVRFNELFEYIRVEANISLNIIDDEERKDGINFYIGYVGPLGGVGANRRVKVDISKSEKLEFKPEKRDMFVDYTDQEGHQLLCYSLEEILIEKLRSVMQRMQARDFYDIWYLLEEHGMDPSLCLNEFRSKCESKKLNASDLRDKLEEKLPRYKSRWKQSMEAQIRDLPDFDKVKRAVFKHLRKFLTEL